MSSLFFRLLTVATVVFSGRRRDRRSVQLSKKTAVVLVAVLGVFAFPLAAQQASTQSAGSIASAANGEKTWTVNFKETDIQEIIRFVANTLGKTMIIDPKVKGKVQVISSEPVNAQQLY